MLTVLFKGKASKPAALGDLCELTDSTYALLQGLPSLTTALGKGQCVEGLAKHHDVHHRFGAGSPSLL